MDSLILREDKGSILQIDEPSIPSYIQMRVGSVTMALQFSCPTCQKKVDVEISNLGSDSACPHCRATIKLPGDPLSQGFFLNDFQIGTPIGGGSDGSVHFAYDHSGTPFALRVPHEGLIGEEHNWDRFLETMAGFVNFNHPYLVRIITTGQIGDVHFYVMEHCGGLSLSQRIKQGPFSETEVLRILEQMTLGLSYLHQNNVIPLDIHSGKIQFDKADNAKLSDYGLARPLFRGTTPTPDWAVHRLPHSISPEQARGNEPVDARSNLYSFGAIAFGMLTGRPLFFDITSEQDLLTAHIETPAPDVRDFMQVTTPTAIMIKKLLSKDPEDRFQRADQLLSIIRVAKGGGVRAVPSTPSMPALKVAPPVVPTAPVVVPPPVTPVIPAPAPPSAAPEPPLSKKPKTFVNRSAAAPNPAPASLKAPVVPPTSTPVLSKTTTPPASSPAVSIEKAIQDAVEKALGKSSHHSRHDVLSDTQKRLAQKSMTDKMIEPPTQKRTIGLKQKEEPAEGSSMISVDHLARPNPAAYIPTSTASLKPPESPNLPPEESPTIPLWKLIAIGSVVLFFFLIVYGIYRSIAKSNARRAENVQQFDDQGFPIIVERPEKYTPPTATQPVKPVAKPVKPLPNSGIMIDLVLHLSFDGNLQDSSGRNNHGIDRGVLGFEEGKLNQCGILKARQYVSLKRPTDLIFGADTDFTVSFWIWADKLQDNEPVIISNKNCEKSDNPGWAIAFQKDGATWQWNFKGSEKSRMEFKKGGKINDKLWHLITVSHDRKNQATFYQDGKSLGSVSIKGAGSIDTPYPINIGRDGNGLFSLNGYVTIDDLNIWRRALTENDVKLLVK